MIRFSIKPHLLWGFYLSIVSAAPETRPMWHQTDKQLHILASGWVVSELSDNLQEPQAFSWCMGIGVAKELYDEWNYGGFSPEDLVADAIGCGLGIVLNHWLNQQLKG